MTSREKKRLDDLEKRVKELEARPVIPAIIIQPYVPPAEQFRPYAPWQPYVPYTPGCPVWTVAHDQTVQPFGAPGTFTC